jgi:hypothetical protein
MNETSNLPDPELAAIRASLDELMHEVRRQGRAAVAAQAAAESCMAEVQRLALGMSQPHSDAEQVEPSAPQQDPSWLEALLPLFDDVDRSAAQAEAVAASLPRGRWMRAIPWARKAADAVWGLAKGLALLKEKLDETLSDLDVDVDRENDCPFDPERHHAVEVHTSPHARTSSVIEVVRAGYKLGSRRIREAEVVLVAPKEMIK